MLKVMAKIANKQNLDSVLQGAGSDRSAVDMSLKFHGLMKQRGKEVDLNELAFTQAVFHAWNYEGQYKTPIAIGAPAGFGKSTMLNIWTTHIAEHQKDLWGAIVVKSKRSQCEEFAKEINEQTGELTAYPVFGRDYFDNEEAYKTQFLNQKKAPVLVITSKMLELWAFNGKLEGFAVWEDSEGLSRRRTQLIIDERPNFTNVASLTVSKIQKFIDLVRAVSHKVYEYDNKYYSVVKEEAEKLMSELQKPIEENGLSVFRVAPVNPFFQVPASLVYDWKANAELLGNNSYLLDLFKVAVTEGGTGQVSTNKVHAGTSLNIGQVVWRKVSFMNVTVLDATAVNDNQYKVEPFNMIAPVIPEGAYSNTKIYNCSKHNIGMSFYDNHKKGFDQTVKLAKELATKHKRLLVVVYKDMFNKYENVLSFELATGKIALKYFDDERATNSFSNCDAVLFLGMLRKAPTWYIETTRAIEGETSQGFNNRGGLSFDNNLVHDLYLRDIATDRLQGIARTRGYKSDTVKTVYMFSTYEEITTMILEEYEGAELIEWELPFSITGTEKKVREKKKPTAKDFFIEFLQNMEAGEEKTTYVYKEVLKISSAQWKRVKADQEVISVMEQLEISFKGQKIVKF